MPRPAVIYALTLAAVAVAWMIRLLLEPVLGTELPFFTFYFAVIYAAWIGGLRAGLVSLLLGLLIGEYFFAVPRYTLFAKDLVNQFDSVRFLGVGICVSLICEALHRQTRRAEAQSQLVRVTLASIGDAVITTDLAGRVTFLNAVAESLTGWKGESAYGQPLEKVFHIVNESTRQLVESPAVRALQQGVVVGLANHTILIRKDGTETSIDDSAAPIKDIDGKVSGCVLVFRDISDRRDQEIQISGLMSDLQQADRRKDEFLATLAHELRNPLAPFRNMLEVLKRSDGDPRKLQQARDIMERQLGQLVRLVDDLMDVSRISRDKLELRLSQVELASVIYQAAEACQPLAAQAGHDVQVHLPPSPVYLHADPVRLVQIFGNLLNNSCKYTPPAGRISLTAEMHGEEVIVTIKDNGTGIPPDKLESIFEMFSQVERSLERAQGGLGIGLTLVKRLVQMHGGSVEACSAGEGLGSEFIVRLPIVQERIAAEPSPAAAHESAPMRRILVVDDNHDAALSLAELLRISGNETCTAHDGEQALAAVESFRPEVVVLDIGLPKLSGHEVCRRIRERDGGKEIVVIALTGWGQEEDRMKSQEVGFNGHLVKPVDYAALLKLLNTNSTVSAT